MSDSEPSYYYPDACIAMFARAPVLGQVKTRLIPALGENGALEMHLKLMQRQIGVLNLSRLCPSQLWLDQSSDDPAFKDFAGKVKLQKGETLGDKMFHTSKDVLTQFSNVLIIGSDCPEIDEAYLEQALQELSKPSVDVLLGPAKDGGYVLIGMKQAHLEIFQDVNWGSDQVLKQTMLKLEENSLRYSTLATLRDIDTVEDLKSLQ